MNLTQADIENLDHARRLNIINSVTGIKPANLIGTISGAGVANLSIFSSIIHLGSNPALIGFILRAPGNIRRDTGENIAENGFYTINHVHRSFAERAHYTSAKFAEDESEFEACGLTAEYIGDFKAPFVKESRLKLGMELVERIPIALNGTILMIGSVKLAVIPDEIMDARGRLDLAKLDDVGVSGLNSYYALEKIAEFPYARAAKLPDFTNSAGLNETASAD